MQTRQNILAQPLRIGTVTLPNRVALAPMSGVTDLPFRRLAHRYGAGMVVTEMIASRELAGHARESQVRMMRDGDHTHIVQLAGREARWMAEAARIAEGEGADIIDINMGCPSKKVTGGYSGSALMRNLDHALTLIEATVSAVKLPVTLKMRLGWDETSLNAPELAARAEAAGVRAITVHGRTRCQFYKGRADWQAVAAVRERIAVPLIVNGDIATRDDCALALSRSGADAVMIGRGAEGRPWLPGELAEAGSGPKTIQGLLDLVLEHYETMLVHYGVETGVRQARKHLGWYIRRFAPEMGVATRYRIMTGTIPSEVMASLRELFATAVKIAPAVGRAA